MTSKKKYNYVGLVGRGQTAAYSLLDVDNLNFKDHSAIFKFPANRYYEHMYMLATAALNKALTYGIDTVLYTIDTIIDSTRIFFKKYRPGTVIDIEALAEEIVLPKRKYNNANNDLINLEKKALVDYLLTVQRTYISSVNIKFEKAKEVDMLTLNIPKGISVTEDEVLTFENGKARDNISVYGWSNYSRKTARVKVRYEKTNGITHQVFFLYRNDRTALGRSKSDMLRYLWSMCPSRISNDITKFEAVG